MSPQPPMVITPTPVLHNFPPHPPNVTTLHEIPIPNVSPKIYEPIAHRTLLRTTANVVTSRAESQRKYPSSFLQGWAFLFLDHDMVNSLEYRQLFKRETYSPLSMIIAILRNDDRIINS